MTLPSPWLSLEWDLIFFFINPQPQSPLIALIPAAVWVKGVSTVESSPSSTITKQITTFWVPISRSINENVAEDGPF